jgi:hypothetical protein
VAGVGDFHGNGTDDILFRNNTTGDVGYYAIVNGTFAGWHDIAGSSTAYNVVNDATDNVSAEPAGGTAAGAGFAADPLSLAAAPSAGGFSGPALNIGQNSTTLTPTTGLFHS